MNCSVNGSCSLCDACCEALQIEVTFPPIFSYINDLMISYLFIMLDIGRPWCGVSTAIWSIRVLHNPIRIHLGRTLLDNKKEYNWNILWTKHDILSELYLVRKKSKRYLASVFFCVFFSFILETAKPDMDAIELLHMMTMVM